MAWVGRDLEDLPFPPLCHGRDTPSRLGCSRSHPAWPWTLTCSFTASSLFFAGLSQRHQTLTFFASSCPQSQPKQASSKEKLFTCSWNSCREELCEKDTQAAVEENFLSRDREHSNTSSKSIFLGRRIGACLSPLALHLSPGVQVYCCKSRLEVAKSFHSN